MLLNGLFAFVVALTLIFVIFPVARKWNSASSPTPPTSLSPSPASAWPSCSSKSPRCNASSSSSDTPRFSLSVALFGLLISSGIGSFTCGSLDLSRIARTATLRLVGLLLVLALIGIATPPIVRSLAGASTPLRVIVALVLLAPAGFFMGMAFPMLMLIATARHPNASAWFWGINGGASICASVLAVMISTSWGISAAWWSGVACYILATAMILRAARSAQTSPANTESPLITPATTN